MTDQNTAAMAPSGRRRAAALLAYLTLLAAVAYVAVVTFRRWEVLLAGVVLLAVMVLAGWFAVSRRGSARLIALGLAVAALALFAVVMVSNNFVRVLVVGVLLVAASAAAARVALHEPRVASTEEGRSPAAPRPRHPVLIMNPWSGGGKVERFGLEQRCRDLGIEPIVLVRGSDLLALAEDAVARGADVIGMAGGDGSQALVASVASRHGIPFVVVSAGTRNHFALDLGMDRDDVLGSLDAFHDGVDRRIDLAEVNGRVFVNNASMGLYARIVQSAEYRDAKIQTAADVLPDLIGPNATPLDLQFTLPSGERATSANLVLVSNNPYQLSHLRGAALRPRLDRGELGVVSVQVRGAADAQKLAALEVAGQVQPLQGLERVDPHGLRGHVRRPRGGRGRRGGVDHGPAAALRHPARCADDPAAEGGVGAPRARTGGAPRVDVDPVRPVEHGSRTAGGRMSAAGPTNDTGPMDDTGGVDPAEERLARGLRERLATGPGAHPLASGAARVLETLGHYDRALYVAVARTSTPALDVPLRRLSHFANFSKPWFLTATALAVFGGPTGRRAALTGVAAIGAASLVVNQPMKYLGDRQTAGPRRTRGARASLGQDADVDVVPVRPLRVGRRLRRGRQRRGARPARAAHRRCRDRGVLARVHRGPLPRRCPRGGRHRCPAGAPHVAAASALTRRHGIPRRPCVRGASYPPSGGTISARMPSSRTGRSSARRW